MLLGLQYNTQLFPRLYYKKPSEIELETILVVCLRLLYQNIFPGIAILVKHLLNHLQLFLENINCLGNVFGRVSFSARVAIKRKRFLQIRGNAEVIYY